MWMGYLAKFRWQHWVTSVKLTVATMHMRLYVRRNLRRQTQP